MDTRGHKNRSSSNKQNNFEEAETEMETEKYTETEIKTESRQKQRHGHGEWIPGNSRPVLLLHLETQRQGHGESQLEGEGVDPWGQQDRYSSYI